MDTTSNGTYEATEARHPWTEVKWVKVNINFTVEVDAEAWDMTYGIDAPGGVRELRRDVKSYFENATTAAHEEGLIR